MINFLAQGHNALTPVRLEPTALWSRVKHSTTELPHQMLNMFLTVILKCQLRFSHNYTVLSLINYPRCQNRN